MGPRTLAGLIGVPRLEHRARMQGPLLEGRLDMYLHLMEAIMNF